MTNLFKATCAIAGCTAGAAGAPYETPVFRTEQEAARDISDHFSAAHALAAVQTAPVDPQFPLA